MKDYLFDLSLMRQTESFSSFLFAAPFMDIFFFVFFVPLVRTNCLTALRIEHWPVLPCSHTTHPAEILVFT